jgi:hypothetical protein
MSTTFNMSDNKSTISLSAIPKLRNNANFAAWKQAVENQLLLAGCIGIVDGSDIEPFRTARAMAARICAGSAPPTATERIPDTDLTVEQLDEWRKWQKREEKVQGMIRTTVSDGIVRVRVRVRVSSSPQ